MQFRILGTVEVVGEDGPTPVGGHRERALLARLLLSPNQVVSSPVLTDDLWSGAPTEGAAQALWVHVSRLRKTLRDHGGDDLLVTRPPGYVLQTDLEAIDAYRFETLVDRARRLAASGEPAAAAGTFRQALALWRGPALADVAAAPFAQSEAARLDEARLTVLEARIEADLAAGLDSDLVGELASLTREHPLRERLWALRMTALYRAGRQAEALRTYQELRRYLGEELGIDPSEELRALEVAILRQEAHLARREAPVAPAQSAPSSPGVVTFMFTDVVGSTELLDRLGDEKADDLRRRHFAALRQALTAHGGSEVKSLGDGLMAAFASPVAALRCAVEIQQTAAAGRDDALAIRIGIHAGEPIADEDDFFGSPVVVAQRLSGRARGGQILVSALVQGLAGNRAGCAFTTLGGLALKGFAEPVVACEVHWAAQTTRDVVPLPVPLARQDSVFIRPDADMTRIDEAWEAARSGRRHVVLLAGEPGIGKTRTSAEVARMAHEAGATVLYGRCEERMGAPYQPFVEALGTYIRQAPHPELGRLAGELARLAPELRERFPDVAPPLSADPDTERYRLFDAVAAWLAAVAAHNPAALLLDDLHWATAPTLAMLGHLACSGEPGSLLV
ncbi:MAG: AAA family ATPase, partial [Actinobacteria bacterium]|nr:AAA family ATPase [Actinomycetota bacterium]